MNSYLANCYLSILVQARREKISERMKILQDLVPGCNKVSIDFHLISYGTCTHGMDCLPVVYVTSLFFEEIVNGLHLC